MVENEKLKETIRNNNSVISEHEAVISELKNENF